MCIHIIEMCFIVSVTHMIGPIDMTNNISVLLFTLTKSDIMTLCFLETKSFTFLKACMTIPNPIDLYDILQWSSVIM